MPPHSKLTLNQAIFPVGTAQAGPADAVAPPDLLGALCYGVDSALDSQRNALSGHDCAVQYVALPLLGTGPGEPGSCLWQSIYSDWPVRSGHSRRIRYRTDGVFVFGVLELPRVSDEAGELTRSAQDAYDEIFTFLQTLDSRQRFKLWRVWNYMPDIHGEENNLERYRQFNSGRLRAFAELWAAQSLALRAPYDPFCDIPASCAVGIDGPSPRLRLTVAFLASPLTFVQIENPRQVSAYQYPTDYGPSSPTFSRAVLGPMEFATDRQCPYFFISGTGSIVGHRTLHRGDVAEQCRESLRNIEALVREANRRLTARDQPTLTMVQPCYLVYLRYPQHLSTVQQVLSQALGSKAKVRFLQAEICRSDLLVEIEATLLSAALPA